MRVWRNPHRGARGALPTCVAVATFLLAGCGAPDGAPDGAADDATATDDGAGFGHVHSLDVNPADDRLYVATHNGVFVHAEGDFDRVGKGTQDTMSFTIAGPDRFLISGHPAPGSGGPAHLGLTESTDGGRSWQPLSLEGEADFHALEVAGDRVYGVDSQSGLLKVTSDGKQWRDLGQLPATDVAADPAEPERLLLTDGRGAVVELEASRQPRLVESAPRLVLLDWVSGDLLAGVGPEGAVHTSRDGGESWQESGTLPEPPHAFTATEGRWFAATESGILTSTDEGSTWTGVNSQ
jgi:hypothetical protein